MDRAALEKLNVDELRKRAAEREIEGRSEMDKDELVAAIEKSYRKEPPPGGDAEVGRAALDLEPRIG